MICNIIRLLITPFYVKKNKYKDWHEVELGLRLLRFIELEE